MSNEEQISNIIASTAETAAAGKKPYIIIVDTGAHEYTYEDLNLQATFNAGQILEFRETASQSMDIGLGIATRQILGEDSNAWLLERRNAKLKPLLDEAAKRGYPPAAIIGCPYYTDRLLQGSTETQGLLQMGFKGPITLMLGIEEESYREELPMVFEQRVEHIISHDDSEQDTFQAIIQTLEQAGIERITPGFTDRFVRNRKTGFPPLGC